MIDLGKSNKYPKTYKDILFVLFQFVILILFFMLPIWWHFNVNDFVFISGYIIAAAGPLIIIWASINLGRSISPFPTPKEKGVLITNGIFKFIRHPIYSGFLVFLIGLSISTGSLSRIVITLLAMIFFSIKASYEEQRLMKKYPEYIQYKERTGKFIPKIVK